MRSCEMQMGGQAPSARAREGFLEEVMQGGVASVGAFQVKNREGGRQEQLCSDLGSAFTALPVVLLGWALGLGGGAQLFLVVQARGLAAGERRMAAGERRIKVGCVPEVG